LQKEDFRGVGLIRVSRKRRRVRVSVFHKIEKDFLFGGMKSKLK
jgi:hypothetical protein